ncbi:MAG: neuraminidase-like domain-containing protein [Myxococcota bacterium]
MSIYDQEGTVIDSISGAGLAGVRVELWDVEQMAANALGEATTDQDGRFSMSVDEAVIDGILGFVPAGFYFRVFDGEVEIANTDNEVTWLLTHSIDSAKIVVERPLAIVVDGMVADATGGPIANADVQVHGRRTEAAGVVDTLLAQTPSNADGRFRLRHTVSDGRPINLIVQAYDGTGMLLAESSEISRASGSVSVELVVGGDRWEGPSELEQIDVALARELTASGATVVGMAEDAARTLARTTSIEQERVVELAAAATLADATTVPREVFFGLARDGLAPDLHDLMVVGADLRQTAFENAVARGAVPALPGITTNDLMQQLSDALVVFAMGEVSTPDRPAIKDIVASSQVDPSRHQDFIRLFVERTGTDEDFWQAVSSAESEGTPVFSAEDVEELQTIIRCTQALQGWVAPLQQLTLERAGGQYPTFRSIAAIERSSWVSMVQATGPSIEFPSHVPGQTEQERLDHYVDAVIEALDAAFPNDALRRELTGSSALSAHAKTLLDNTPDVDLRTADLAKYTANNPGSAFAGIAPGDQASALAEVQTVQRLFTLTSKSSYVRALVEAGFHSALQIAHASKDELEQALASVSSGVDDAQAIQATAKSKVNTVQLATLTAGQMQYKLVSLTESDEEPSEQAQSLQQLTGSTSYCRCAQCQSVHGPAAYLVDLMGMLDQGGEAEPNNPLNVLLRRRPDLAELELTCANVDTALPYVDLVNEILESVVDHVSDGDPGASSDPTGELTASTTGDLDSEVLLATPQNIIPAAYDALAQAHHPLSLPFAEPWEVVRATLDHGGLSRLQVMTTLRGPTTPTAREIAYERLGLAFEQGEIITDPAPETWSYYGLPNAAEWDTTLLAVPDLLTRASLEFDDLQALLATRFIPGDNPISIDTPGGECDLSQMLLSGANAGTFDRLHRFVRLQRACGWSTAELDLALHSLESADLGGLALERLAVIEGLRQRLDASVEQLCALWAPIDTWGEPSHYAALFMNPTVLPTVATAFTLDGSREELLDTSQPLDTHATAVASALGATMEELDTLRTALGYTGPVTMTLAMLSELYRHVTLARLMQISVTDLLALMTMTGADPFYPGDPTATGDFVTRAMELTQSPISFPELRYLVLHEAEPSQSPAPSDDSIEHALETMLEDLTQVSEIYAPPAEMSEAELARRLSVFIDDDALVRELVAALDLRVPTDGDGGLPIADRASLYATHVEAVDASDHPTLFDNVPTGEVPLAERHAANLTLVIEALNSWLRDKLAPATVASSLGAALEIEPAIITALLERHLQGITHPAAPLMEDFVQMTAPAQAQQSYLRLHKAVRIVQTLRLSEPELAPVFATLDDPAPAQPADLRTWPVQSPVATPEALLEQWRQLSALASLGPSMDRTVATPGDLASAPQTGTPVERLANATGWNVDDLAALQAGFGWSDDDLTVGTHLVRLREAVTLVRGLGVSAEVALEWASQAPTTAQAQQVVRAIKARHEGDDWLAVAKALNDPLRDARREALVDYLVHRLQPAGVHTVADLSAYLLLDIEMTSCMQTSRIKQAISTVQRFVQRILLNLERGPEPIDPTHEDNISPDVFDREQWAWRKSYRQWEANRKTFLYPENWLEPELRMDRTPLFRELEGALMQQDLTDEVVHEAVTNYLQGLHAIARMEVVGLSRTEASASEDEVLHVVGRTTVVPRHYYHRTLSRGRWSPWEKLDVDIQSEHHLLTTEGGRVRLFWLALQDVTEPEDPPTDSLDYDLRVHVMDYRAGRWHPPAALPGVVRLNLHAPDGDDPTRFRLGQRERLEGTTVGVQALSSQWRHCAWVRGSCGNEQLVPDSGPVNPQPRPPANMEWSRQIATSRPAADEHGELSLKTIYFVGQIIPNEVRMDVWWPILTAATQPSALLPSTLGQKNMVTRYYDFAYMDDHGVYIVLARDHGQPIPPYPLESTSPPTDGGWTLAAELQVGVFDPSSPPSELAPVSSNHVPGALTFHTFHHPHVCDLMEGWTRRGPDGLFADAGLAIIDQAQVDGNDHFHDTYAPTNAVAQPYPRRDVDFDYGGAYAQYNCELFFHVPLLIAMRLQQAQRHAEAQRWFHYVFDPTTTADPDAGTARYWKYKPLRDTNAVAQVNTLLAALTAPDADPALVNSVRAQLVALERFPFEPHRIAQLRPVAYQLYVVMRYLDTLIEWGDRLFRRDTIESINEATQLYELAAHVLGPKPTALPAATPETTQSYGSLRTSLLAASASDTSFGNVLIEAENLVLGSATSAQDGGGLVHAGIGAAMFCLSPNEHLLGYWDLLADRLFKIRHCQNIEGQQRTLALFAPPIDPSLLIRAQAAGLDLGAVLDDRSAGPGNYRFSVLLAKAQQLAAEARSLGASLLSAVEKRDAEALAALRAKHEVDVLDVLRQVKLEQQQEVAVQRKALEYSREHANQRNTFYRQMLSGDGRIAQEREQLSKLGRAHFIQQSVSHMQLMASVQALIPDITVGLGAGSTFGGSFIARASQAIANAYSIDAAQHTYEANRAAIVGGWERRRQEWQLQLDQSAKEMERIDQELLAAEIREQVLAAELATHDEQTRTAQDVANFLSDKLTNAELYGWLERRLSQLYFSTYNLAYDIAKRAERAYRYELGVEGSTIVRAGHWNDLRKGLLAAEHLTLDLQRLDVAYIDADRREYELTKSVSLAQLAPEALMELRAGNAAVVELGEGLFDLDHPGHYMRRLKAVRMTLPVVAGPYSGVHAKLTLLGSQVRKDAIDENYTDASHFDYRYGPLESICTSSGQSDPGVFELSFQDPRYLPFEGAGAISRWRIELPPASNRFDLRTLSDVVLHLSYTAREGGAQLAEQASIALAHAPRRAMRMFSLRHEFPVEWNAFLTQLEEVSGGNPDPSFDQVLQVSLAGRLPYLSGSGAVMATKASLAVRWASSSQSATPNVTVTPANGAVSAIALAVAPDTSELPPAPANPPPSVVATVAPDAEASPWTIRITHGELANLTELTESYGDGTRIIPDQIEDIILIVEAGRAP